MSAWSPRIIAAFVLLPLAEGLERFAYYGTRAVSHQALEESGLDTVTAMTSSYGAMVIGGVLAGVLAAALLPRIVLVAGGVCAAAGYFIIAGAHDPDWVLWGLRFAGAGAGMMKACLYGLALLVLPTPRLRLLYIALAYVVLNIAGAVAAPLGGLAASSLGASAAFVVAGVLILVGLIPAIAYIVIDKLAATAAISDDDDVVQTPGDPGRAVLGAMVMAVCTMPLLAASSAASARMWRFGMSGSMMGIVDGISTLVTVATVVALAAWLLSRKGSAPASFLVGVCLMVAVGGALIACVPVTAGGVLAVLVFGVAEVATPLALARSLANQHPRVVTLVAGFSFVFSSTGAHIGNAGEDSSVVVLVVAAVLCAVAGGLLIGLGNALDAWLDAPRAPAPESWLNPQAPVQGSSSSQSSSSPS